LPTCVLGGDEGIPTEVARALRFGLQIHGSIVCRWLDQLSACFLRWPPGLLLLNNDLESVRRSAARFCQQRGVPVVNVQHGMINDSAVYRLGISDRHLLWGDAFTHVLQSLGIMPEKLVAVGAPQFERPADYAPPSPPASSHRRLMYAAQPATFEIPEETCRHLVDVHCRLAEANPDLEVTIRMHPREAETTRTLAAKRIEGLANARMCDAPDIASALARCDLVSTVFSTASIDAAVARKPTLLLDFVGIGHRFPFPRQPPWFSVERENDLAAAAKHATGWAAAPDNDKWQRFDREYLHGLDGRAAERAATEIVGLLRTRCRP
jgi:hypothetical protein